MKKMFMVFTGLIVILVILSVSLGTLSVPVSAKTTSPAVVSINGELISLRRQDSLSDTHKAPSLKKWHQNQGTIVRNYVQQPPLIPHKTKGYDISLRINRCLTCHSWNTYKASGATKISFSHFRDQDGNELANISPRRFFCTQCHVPQKETPPLVNNTYEPIKLLSTK